MRKLWLIIGIFIILLNISGCFWQKEQDKKETFILYSVVDATGTRLDFEEKPVRIMSMNISIDEVLWEIVEKDRIVALSKLADDPQISSISKEVKNLKGRVSSGNIEQILAYQPDLIIVPDYNIGFIKSLRSLGLKVYVCKTPVNVDEIFTYINKISKVVGEQEKGENLVKELKIKLATITKNVENNIPENKRKKVIVLTSTGLLGSKGTFSDICYYAGVKNCFADEDIMFEGIFPKELLLKVKPDIIMISDWNFNVNEKSSIFIEDILKNPLYKDLPAIKNNQIYKIHSNYLNSTSQNFIKGVEEITLIAYPEINFKEGE